MRELAGERRLECAAETRGRHQATSGGHNEPRVSEATHFCCAVPLDSQQHTLFLIVLA
jgi:hypothetical protein